MSFNSIIYGTTFSNGLFKDGYWLNGIFNNGIFADSNNIISTTMSYDNYISGYYRSWRDGVFNNGQFYNSVWIDGTFNNGQFYNSDWYGGLWNNGILGIKNSPYLLTTMGYYNNLGIGATVTVFNNGVVNSAIIGGSSSIYWYNGDFNDGDFTSFGVGYPESIWYNGNFNGGRFDGLAKWKNGIFNNGKFISHYGFTLSNSTNILDYSWENGQFNNGQFGNISIGTNSTWYDGQFSGGVFGGIVWNNGIFTNGIFMGSGTSQSYLNEENFVDSFSSSYYGLWRDGYVANSIHIGKPNQKVYTSSLRNTDTKKISQNALFQNILWLGGTFSHNSGIINNGVWLNGTFDKGSFNNSSFNPYISYPYGNIASFNFSNSCIWINGILNNSSFYISEWQNGTFNNGIMLGGIWNKGTWVYVTAQNILWKSGTWKNGNWFGANFDYKSLTGQNITNITTRPTFTCEYDRN